MLNNTKDILTLKELQELLDEGDRRIRVLTGEGERPLAGEEEA